jgi:CheY-like chemotaxis protein/anti-sigma regulatory factor (Ser/Thr protein kinase)
MSGSDPVSVLLVDDVADLRRVVRGVLDSQDGFVVVGEAADGVEAVDAAARLQPAVILLDLDMPVVSGVEALPLLREAAPDAKVVVLSALPRGSMEPVCRSAGSTGFIEKGIGSRKLVRELIEVLGLLETVERALASSRLVVEDSLQSPRVARRFVDQTLSDWGHRTDRDLIELIVSELVTNAVTHARSSADVAVILRADAIRIEVGDANEVHPTPQQSPPDATSGRGLDLVERVAAAWGVMARAGGKVVWFEIARDLGSPAEVIIA